MTEEQVHKSICKYIDIVYPGVEFNSDLSGIKLTKGQAKQAAKLRKSRGFPDLVLYEPRGQYHGFHLEIKIDGTSVYLQSGGFTVDHHINEQYDKIKKLRVKGYYAEFGIGYIDCQKKVDDYMKLPKNY
jgi:hypothetical protein